jgi:hypothetical protein
MECMVCRIEVSRSADAAIEFLCWKTELGTLNEKTTGRAAHIACLQGDRYDERQMTISEVIDKEER